VTCGYWDARPRASERSKVPSPASKRRAGLTKLLLLDPRSMRPVENQREVTLPGRRESCMKERELLVEQLRFDRGVMLEGDGGRRESLEDRLGRYLGDVVEHLAVLRLGVKLPWTDGEGHRALSVRSANRDANATDVLSWLEPSARVRVVVEAEELARGIQHDSLSTVDPKHVCAVFFEGDPIVFAIEVVFAVRQCADGERAKGVAAVVLDRGLDGAHVTR
jgi:hypothetical protein